MEIRKIVPEDVARKTSRAVGSAAVLAGLWAGYDSAEASPAIQTPTPDSPTPTEVENSGNSKDLVPRLTAQPATPQPIVSSTPIAPGRTPTPEVDPTATIQAQSTVTPVSTETIPVKPTRITEPTSDPQPTGTASPESTETLPPKFSFETWGGKCEGGGWIYVDPARIHKVVVMQEVDGELQEVVSFTPAEGEDWYYHYMNLRLGLPGGSMHADYNVDQDKGIVEITVDQRQTVGPIERNASDFDRSKQSKGRIYYTLDKDNHRVPYSAEFDMDACPLPATDTPTAIDTPTATPTETKTSTVPVTETVVTNTPSPTGTKEETGTSTVTPGKDKTATPTKTMTLLPGVTPPSNPELPRLGGGSNRDDGIINMIAGFAGTVTAGYGLREAVSGLRSLRSRKKESLRNYWVGDEETDRDSEVAAEVKERKIRKPKREAPRMVPIEERPNYEEMDFYGAVLFHAADERVVETNEETGRLRFTEDGSRASQELFDNYGDQENYQEQVEMALQRLEEWEAEKPEDKKRVEDIKAAAKHMLVAQKIRVGQKAYYRERRKIERNSGLYGIDVGRSRPDAENAKRETIQVRANMQGWLGGRKKRK